MAAARKQGPSPSRLEARLCDLGRGRLSLGCMGLALVADGDGRPQPTLLAAIVWRWPVAPQIGTPVSTCVRLSSEGVSGEGFPAVTGELRVFIIT